MNKSEKMLSLMLTVCLLLQQTLVVYVLCINIPHSHSPHTYIHTYICMYIWEYSLFAHCSPVHHVVSSEWPHTYILASLSTTAPPLHNCNTICSKPGHIIHSLASLPHSRLHPPASPLTATSYNLHDTSATWTPGRSPTKHRTPPSYIFLEYDRTWT